MFENLFVKTKEQKTQTKNMFEGIFDKAKETTIPTITPPTTLEERQSLSLGLPMPGEMRTTTPITTEEEWPIAIAKTIGQGIARSFIAVGTEAREQLLVPKAERKPFGEATYTPQNETEKKIFGTDKPISFKTIGEETLAIGGEEFKQKWGKYSLPIGVLMANLDIIPPVGGGKIQLLKEASKIISKTDDVVKIAKTLKPIFKGTDEEIEVLAKSLKLINKEDEVLKVLETAGKARGATPIAPEATKLGVSAEKGIIPQELQPIIQEIKAVGKVLSPQEIVSSKVRMGYLTEKDNIPEMIKQHGEFPIVVKDVNGNRATINASDFVKLSENKAFTDRIKEIWVRSKPIPAGLEYGTPEMTKYLESGREVGLPVGKPNIQEGFMEALQINKLLKEPTKAPLQLGKLVDVEGITLTNNSTITRQGAERFKTMLTDNKVRQALKDNGIKEVIIEPPYKFQLSEQANISPSKRIIRINADATNPTDTIFHELGHQKFKDLPLEEQKTLIELAKKTTDPAMQGYKKLEAWEEIIADSLYKKPDFYTQAVKGVGEVKSVVETIKETAPKTLPQKVGKETTEQVFRADKLNLGPEQISNIEKRLEALGLKTRTIRTFEDVKRAAQELGVDTRRLLTETAQSRITDKEVVALRNTINTLADDIIRQEKNIILNPKQEQILNIKLGQSEQMLDMALNKLTKGGTEAGRTVSAFRIMAEKTLDPTFWLKKAKTIAGGRKLTSDEVIAITDLIKNGDRQGLANFVSMLRNPSFAEMAITLWKAGLLTSPTTHLANIGGNLTMAGLMTASDVVSTGFDILASLVTGKRTTTIGFSTIAAKVKGFVGGAKAAKTYLTKGIYSADVLKKWDMPRQTIFKNKILNGYVQSVFRTLGAEDILFRQAAMAESFEKSAIVMAKNEKLSGQAFKARVKELLTNPTNEMVMNAIDAAEYATFQSPNALANFIRAGKAVAGEPLRATVEFVAPFTLTPTNIAARIMDFTPAGFVKAIIQGIRPATRSQKAIVESLGRTTTGTGIMALGTYLASKGLMTGNMPEDANDRAMFYAEGKQANSIQIGSNWLSLNRISPIGNLMALGAEFYQLSKEQEGLQLAGATGLAGIKGLTEQTFLQGVSSALKVINEPERQFERYVQRGMAGLVLSIIGRTARTIDPKLRIPENVFEAVEERIPFLRKKVAPRRDIFGEIAPVPGGQFNLFDPFAITKAKNDPVINEAKKIGAVIGMPSQTISGVKLDSHEYSVYQKVQGKILHETLLTLINSPDYQQLSVVDKNKAFDSYTRNIRTQLNDMLFPALIIKRYDLPKETNPQILRALLGELFQNDKFKQFSEEKQSKVIKKLLEGYAGEK